MPPWTQIKISLKFIAFKNRLNTFKSSWSCQI
jgi:hypothetical protein